MSRTYRKHAESFEESHKWLIEEIYSGLARWYVPGKYLTEEEIEQSKKELEVYRYKYKTQTRKYYGLPKEFRNMVNRTRRNKDKSEIWKAINFKDHEEQCSKWTCKDNNHWGWY